MPKIINNSSDKPEEAKTGSDTLQRNSSSSLKALFHVRVSAKRKNSNPAKVNPEDSLYSNLSQPEELDYLSERKKAYDKLPLSELEQLLAERLEEKNTVKKINWNPENLANDPSNFFPFFQMVDTLRLNREIRQDKLDAKKKIKASQGVSLEDTESKLSFNKN
jgi:hypothetical protein